MTGQLPPGWTQRYRVIACPRCGNRSFSFQADGQRRCVGPEGRCCGFVWESGPAGRQVVGWREPAETSSMTTTDEAEAEPSRRPGVPTGADCPQHPSYPLTWGRAQGSWYAWCRRGRHWVAA